MASKSSLRNVKNEDHEKVLLGLEEMMKEHRKCESTKEGEIKLLQPRFISVNKDEQFLSVERNFDLLMEYVRARHFKRRDDSELKALDKRAKIAEKARDEYIQLHNDAVQEMKKMKLHETQRKEKEEEDFSITSEFLQCSTTLNETMESMAPIKIVVKEDIEKTKILNEKIKQLQKAVLMLERKNDLLESVNEGASDELLELVQLRKERDELESSLQRSSDLKSQNESELQILMHENERLNAKLKQMEYELSKVKEKQQDADLIPKKRVRFFSEHESATEFVEKITASKRLEPKTPQSIQEFKQEQENSRFEQFLLEAEISDSADLMSCSKLLDFLFDLDCYVRLDVPSNVFGEEWKKILCKSYNEKCTAIDLEEMKQIMFVLISERRRKEYDLLLKHIDLLNAGFSTECFDVQSERSSWFNKSDFLKLRKRKVHVMFDSSTRRVFVLNKYSKTLPSRLQKNEHSFLLVNVVRVEFLVKTNLGRQIRDLTDCEHILHIDFTFKKKPCQLLMEFGDAEKAKEFKQFFNDIKTVLAQNSNIQETPLEE